MDFLDKPSIARENRLFTGQHVPSSSLATREEAVEALHAAQREAPEGASLYRVLGSYPRAIL
jgi:hypothetical protein